ncbi:phosphotransferase [Akkermansiaceae bacterium]|nr:phosphotransferase [Akkermansiaceae bacterium]
MILPDQMEGFREGLALYYPQRLLAKILVKALKKFAVLRGFLKTDVFDFVSSGPVESLLRENKADMKGLLLGNPSQKERRGLLLYSDQKGAKMVAKIGTTPEARRKISREASLLVALNEADHPFPAVPPIIAVWDEEGWNAFTLGFYEVNPASSISRSEVVQVLSGWASDEKNLNLQTSQSWADVSRKLTEDELEISAQLKLRSSLRHGDFAPWNILETSSNEPMVIDWEFGRLEDVPGWDLVHFLILEASLIDRRAPRETLESTLRLLETDEQLREFLKFTGWVGHEKLLVKSYLLIMGDQLVQFSPFLNGPVLSNGARYHNE